MVDNRGVTLVGTCLEGCNQISSVSRRVKCQSAETPVPCPSIVKEYNNDMCGVHLFHQRTPACKLDRKSSSGRYYLMDIAAVNSHVVYKCRTTCITHTSRRKVLPTSVPLHLPVIQTTKGKCRYCYNAGIENKTCMQCNIYGVFYALFLVKIQETVLPISILRI